MHDLDIGKESRHGELKPASQPASQQSIHPSAAKATATHSHTIHADMGYTLTERTKRPTDRQQQQPTTTRLYAVYT